MLSKIGKIIAKNGLIQNDFNLRMGIELEMNRVQPNGHLVNTDSPLIVESKKTKSYFTKDYLESMAEQVTDPGKNIFASSNGLKQLNYVLRRNLNHHELLWPFSMPPILPQHQGSEMLSKVNPQKRAYFENIRKRNGISHGGTCGIHLNFCLHQSFIEQILRQTDQFDSANDLKSHLYLKIAQGMIKYRWLLTYLLGASPLAENNYYKPSEHPNHLVRSLRQSRKYGFVDELNGDYTNLQRYVQRIQDGISKKIIIAPSEFHGPIRFRNPNATLDELPQKGIEYLEFRIFDLDYTSPFGVDIKTLEIIQLMLLYFLVSKPISPNLVMPQINRANRMNEKVALANPEEPFQYRRDAMRFTQSLKRFVFSQDLDSQYLDLIIDMQNQIEHPKLTKCGRLVPHIRRHSLVRYGMKQAQQFQQLALNSREPFLSADEIKKLSQREVIKRFIFKR